MTGSKEVVKGLLNQLLTFSHVTVGNNARLKVLGYGNVVITPELSIEKVLLVESLSYNLLSVGQLCNVGYTVIFNKHHVTILFTQTLKVAFVGFRVNGLYVVDFSKETTQIATCLMAKSDKGWLWHRRLGHVGMRNLQTLVKGGHVVGLTDVNFSKDRPCSACIAGKMHEKNHPKKSIISTERPLELLHMDLFGPPTYDSLGGKKYCLVIVDDYSRYCWTFYIKKKSETQKIFIDFATLVQRQYDSKILAIRSDNGTEFKNYTMDDFLSGEGIQHQYSAAYTPQQNGVAERKNRTLIDMARTMMAEFHSPYNFWAKPSTPLVTTQTGSSSVLSWKRHHMNSSPVKSQMYLTFESLDANAMFTLKVAQLLNLHLELLMVFLLDMPQTPILIGSTTYPPDVLKNL